MSEKGYSIPPAGVPAAQSGNVVPICGSEVERIVYRGEPVVTFAMVDRLHQRPDGTAGRNFRENRQRFTEGEDFIRVCADEIRRHKILPLSSKAREDVVMLTRRGYLKLTKPMTDDRAWAVQGEMIDRYFTVEAARALTAEDLLANPRQLLALTQGYALEIEDMRRDMAVMKSDVDALDRIAGADDLFGLRVAAKLLQMPERRFTQWLMEKRWAYRQIGTKHLLAYADKTQAGFVTNKASTYTKADGSDGVRDTLKITPKGLTRLAKLLNVVISEGDLFAARNPAPEPGR